jgi:hypothetical protein
MRCLDPTPAVLTAVWLALAAGAGSRPSKPDRSGKMRGTSPGPSSGQDAPPRIPHEGGLDVTFVVTGDLHFGAAVPALHRVGRHGADAADPVGAASRQNPTAHSDALVPVETLHAVVIRDMNGIEGRAWPPAVGGKVDRPSGLVIVGDLTEDGKPEQWESFERYYGLTGTDGKLRMPVFEGIGNHDRNSGPAVAEKVSARHHGSANAYAWDWGALHLVHLGEAPGQDALAWLKRDLDALARGRPVMLFFHYPLTGPWSTDNWFAEGDARDRFARAIEGANVWAIFHGHFHGAGAYRWHGYDVFTPGSVKHGWRSYLVAHVTGDRLTVACWNYEAEGGGYWFNGNRSKGAVDPSPVMGTTVLPVQERALIPYPPGP